MLAPGHFLEVKTGKTGPLDFAWFPKVFPNGKLTVVSQSRFETEKVAGVTFADFLQGDAPLSRELTQSDCTPTDNAETRRAEGSA